MTMKGQGYGLNMLRVKYLENSYFATIAIMIVCCGAVRSATGILATAWFLEFQWSRRGGWIKE